MPYNLTLTMGDQGYAHDQMQVWVEGVLQATVNSAAGAFQVVHVSGVSSTDRVLEILFQDWMG